MIVIDALTMPRASMIIRVRDRSAFDLHVRESALSPGFLGPSPLLATMVEQVRLT